jgi:hypothetical protein
MFERSVQAGTTAVNGKGARHLPRVTAKEVYKGTRGCCITGSGTTRG